MWRCTSARTYARHTHAHACAQAHAMPPMYVPPSVGRMHNVAQLNTTQYGAMQHTLHTYLHGTLHTQMPRSRRCLLRPLALVSVQTPLQGGLEWVLCAGPSRPSTRSVCSTIDHPIMQHGEISCHSALRLLCVVLCRVMLCYIITQICMHIHLWHSMSYCSITIWYFGGILRHAISWEAPTCALS